MKSLYVKDILDKCNGKLIIGNEDILLDNFSKDTRTIKENDIYVGIKGDVCDGSIYYKDAIEKGAKGCILNNIEFELEYLKGLNNVFVVVVEDTISALQTLASYKRSLYDIPVVAVTGSVGKTSTKDIIASVLSEKYNVCKTVGNYNNHIGLPLTILSLKDENCLVLEMGMSHLGEISLLSKIAKPTISVITNVGTAHIGNLDSRENILKAKLEVLDGMNDQSVLVINNDNDLLHEYYLNNKDKNILTFGINNESDIMAKNIVLSEKYSTFDYLNNEMRVNIPGEVFVLNSLCALLIGKHFNISLDRIKSGISNFELTKRRMEIEDINGIMLINDCYNANFDSMKNAIDYLGSLKRKRKIAVLGDMLELGEYSYQLHRDLGNIINDNNIDIVITVGNEAKYILENLNDNIKTYSFDNNMDTINLIKEIIKKNDAILIKSSYGMNFIEINNAIKEYWQ